MIQNLFFFNQNNSKCFDDGCSHCDKEGCSHGGDPVTGGETQIAVAVAPPVDVGAGSVAEVVLAIF